MRVEDLPRWERALIAAYRWRRVEPLPVASLHKPLPACRIALVTTAGLITPAIPPFDLRRRGGDTSLRVIPSGAPLHTLVVSHRSEAFDREAVERDPNVAFPLGRLRDLAGTGEIGQVAPRHLSFMGSITAPGRLQKESAPAGADLLSGDGVDVALLAPV